MASGNAIIVNADPRGNFGEGVLSGATYPGVHLEIVPATNPVSERYTWRARSSANGAAGPIVVLLNDWEQGGTGTDQIATAVRVKFYWPLPGDKMNCRVAESSGTGTSGSNLIGDRLSVNTSGLLMAGTSTVQPYYLLDRTGLDTYTTALKLVLYLGGYA